ARLAGPRRGHARLRTDAGAGRRGAGADRPVHLTFIFIVLPARRGGETRMFNTVPNPIPARMKGLNRAEICDVNFQEFVRGWNGHAQPKPAPDEAILDGSALDARGFRE